MEKEKLNYEEAATELDGILEELKSDSITIDKLADKVERAATLARFCSEKLHTTEGKINGIVEDLKL